MNAEEREIQRTIRREQDAEEIEASKAKMAAEHGLERNATFEMAWKIAWDYGHSNGLDQVENYFDDLAELLK